MYYQSTRNAGLRLGASEVIAKGISDEGGLFLPVEIPTVTHSFETLATLDYCALAQHILSLYLTDFTEEEIAQCVTAAYRPEKFENGQAVALKQLGASQDYLLELWHGPTCAFKDMALQLLPHLLAVSAQKANLGARALILTATSGDTGKAALSGFQDVPNTDIIVFYPAEGVSPLQKLQMNTQVGANVAVCAVQGNFDDTQTGVKNIFTDPETQRLLASQNMFFSSANSINWGRLLPQIVYYFYAYFELYRTGGIKTLDTPVTVAVPTGNFGNILAAYFAKEMGLPIKQFLCASNANHILTDFIHTGIYDKRRDFHVTTSPSMDILVSSNLERLLYLLSGRCDTAVTGWMKELNERGIYEVDEQTKDAFKSLFYANYCDDALTANAIKTTFANEGYLSDPHTAVALHVTEAYRRETGDDAPCIIASTASPYKFVESVLTALGQPVSGSAFDQIAQLEIYSGTVAQAQLKTLRDKAVRFQDCIAANEMPAYVQKRVSR